MASSDSFDLPSRLKIFIYCVLGMVRRKHSVNNNYVCRFRLGVVYIYLENILMTCNDV